MRIDERDRIVNSPFSRRGAIAAIIAATALILPACGAPNTVPKVQDARAALETSLTAWREGKKPAATSQAVPPIQSVDTDWNHGRQLGSFEILRDQPSEGDKRFVVKLKYFAPPAEVEAVFVVVGSPPIAVFREADFTRSMNMDNNPPAKKRR